MPDDPSDAPATGETKADKPDLGDAGKKAIDEERKARREAEKALKETADRLKALEDKDKTELDKLRDQVATLVKQASEAEIKALRFEVASERGVKPRWLTGATRAELEEAADEYLADHPPAGDKPAPRKPTEALKGGGDPTEEPPVDVRKVVESIPRGM